MCTRDRSSRFCACSKLQAPRYKHWSNNAFFGFRVPWSFLTLLVGGLLSACKPTGLHFTTYAPEQVSDVLLLYHNLESSQFKMKTRDFFTWRIKYVFNNYTLSKRLLIRTFIYTYANPQRTNGVFIYFTLANARRICSSMWNLWASRG